ncbi:MAG: cell division protein FtsA [Chloroflexaceae bacterium]|jgi:cell division protein FtsA|nr:cell division protein FtsA [Chloroflexaceae bacterium]
MNERIIVGLDVGTTKISVSVGQIDANEQIRLIGTATTPARGIDKGMVVNIENAAQSIAACVKQAERLTGFRIETAFVGVSGRHIQSQNNRGVVAVARTNNEITTQDVDRAVESAQAVALASRREILHVLPRCYTVDSHSGIRDPIGMSGFRLEVEAHLVSGDAMAIENLVKSVERAGLGIDELVVGVIADTEALLTADDRERGVVLLDIGAGTTGMAIVTHDAVWHTGVLPVGGAHITNDIAVVQQLPHPLAESLKLAHGSALSSTVVAADDVIHASAGESQSPPVSRTVLQQIVRARVEELADLVAVQIRQSGYEGILPGGVVLTGGTSHLPGLDELFRNTLGVPVRHGRCVNVVGVEDLEVELPSSAVSMGLVCWGARYGVARRPEPKAESRVRPLQNGYTWVKTWLKEFVA